MSSAKPDSAKLDRRQIVETAISIMQNGGIEALSMRKLAAELNIRAPTLYWYFPDRSAILHDAIKVIFGDTVRAVPDADTWQEWLRGFGRQLWLTNKAFPFAVALLQSAELNDNDVYHDVVSQLSARIADYDIDSATFMEAQSHIQALTVGWAVFWQSGMAARLGEMFDVEAMIERGIDGIVLLSEQHLAIR